MTSPATRRMFHDALRACLSEGRAPTQDEVDQLAEKIWTEAYAAKAGTAWNDVPASSTTRQRMISAARGTLSAALPGFPQMM
jgi:hypothetical protein